MNMKIKSLALATLVALASANGLTAQTVGYVTRTLNQNTTNLISIPFDQPPATFTGLTAGVLEGVTGTSLTDNDAAWAVNFATAANPFLVKITSGAAEGYYFRVATTNNTATVVNLFAGEKNPATLGVLSGDSYEIIEGQTLKKFFNLIAVNEGNASTGDQVVLLNNGTFAGPYVRGTNGNWVVGFNASNDVLIRPETGVYFTRRNTGGALTIPIAGVVPTEDQRVIVGNATSNFVNLAFPVDTTFLASGIQNTNGWTNGASGDKLIVLNNGTFTQATFNGTNWVDGFNNRNATPILAGQPVYIIKSSASGTSVLTRPVPY
jgi:hypothetical protein